MKKTLVALAVLAAAGSVNAAEVYNNDGVSVSLNGAGEVQLYQTYEATGGDVPLAVRIDDAQINTRIAVELTDSLSAVAGLDQTFEADSADNKGTVQTDGAFVGFASSSFGTVTFGRQYLIADDSGIGADFEVGFGQYGQDQTVSSDVIKYVYDNGTFYAGLSHDMDEGTDSASDPTSTDGRIGFRAGGLDARIYVFSGRNLTNSATVASDPTWGQQSFKEQAYNVEAVYTFNDAFSMAASYGDQDRDYYSADNTDVATYEINGSYSFGKETVSLGYVHADDHDNDANSNNLYAVAVHKFNPNVRAYAEAGWVFSADEADGTNPDYDMAYTIGMEVSF